MANEVGDTEIQEEIQDLAHRVRRVMERTAEPAIAAGRAILREEVVEDCPLVSLEPTRTGPAGLAVWIDTKHQVTCVPGDSEMIYEIFSKNPTEIEEGITGLVHALIEGRYFELASTKEGKPRVIAEWPEGDRVRRPRRNVWRKPKPGSPGWKTVRYEAY